jgi:hypothetical protein
MPVWCQSLVPLVRLIVTWHSDPKIATGFPCPAVQLFFGSSAVLHEHERIGFVFVEVAVLLHRHALELLARFWVIFE